MAQIIFDKGKDSERSYKITNFFERISDKTLNASMTYQIKEGLTIPEIEPLTETTFETVEIVNDAGTKLPVVNSYNAIVNFTTQYFDEDGFYSYNIDIGYRDESAD